MQNNPMAAVAHYTAQRIPHYQGNPLIEALPGLLDDDEMLRALFDMPTFEVEQRDWSKHERLNMIAQLSNFLLPMQRHIEFAHSLDAMIRQGYVGRVPRTKKAMAIFNRLHERRQSGVGYVSNASLQAAQLSASLTGVPGMGKTSVVRRILSRYPAVIYHPELQHYQVPVLCIEAPYDGASVKGTVEAILRKMDGVLPDAGYADKYCSNRASTETMMHRAEAVLNLHSVGLLIVDEIQNLTNAPKNRQALMTLLVSISNNLGVPILFIGTNKAQELLTLDFRQARRSSGSASACWGPLVRGTEAAPCEWEDFLSILWRFQWVKHPVALNAHFIDLMFHHSQGIIDIAIKLFSVAQTRAIHSGAETLSAELIDEVAKRDLDKVRPMIEALRCNDLQTLQSYGDIAPRELTAYMSDIQGRYTGRRNLAAQVAPQDPLFKPMVADALEGLGFSEADAIDQAERQVIDARNVLDGVKRALSYSMSGTKPKASKPVIQKSSSDYPPGDYRRALCTDVAGETVYERLKTLNMLSNWKQALRP